KAAKSPALFDIYSAFVEVVRAEMADVATPEFVRSENDRLHDALCDAIAAGDARKARRLVRSHLEGSLAQHTARLK
ncbi:MAG TPA: FCD domain-containing protein, partial [Candidatus Baltobacteraceae bacterium]|nr:FCD domain-containing protein [Candidatus Baltobacteraceae bacterium]